MGAGDAMLFFPLASALWLVWSWLLGLPPPSDAAILLDAFATWLTTVAAVGSGLEAVQPHPGGVALLASHTQVVEHGLEAHGGRLQQ